MPIFYSFLFLYNSLWDAFPMKYFTFYEYKKNKRDQKKNAEPLDHCINKAFFTLKTHSTSLGFWAVSSLWHVVNTSIPFRQFTLGSFSLNSSRTCSCVFSPEVSGSPVSRRVFLASPRANCGNSDDCAWGGSVSSVHLPSSRIE